MHQRDKSEPRGRFGLPPEQPARRAPLSPVRAFIVLAAVGLIAWVIVADGSTDSSRDVGLEDSDANVSGGIALSPSPVAAEEAMPTEADVLEAFQALDELRARVGESGARRVLMPGLSLRGLERAVPAGGRTLEVRALSLGHDEARVRQVIELSSWDVDLTAEDISLGRLRRRLGIEWALAHTQDGWRIAAWTVVEDRAVVGR